MLSSDAFFPFRDNIDSASRVMSDFCSSVVNFSVNFVIFILASCASTVIPSSAELTMS